jgi:hypothetical protein
MDKNKKVVFTHHARERFPECNFNSISDAVKSFLESVEDKSLKKFKDMKDYKNNKYSQNDVARYNRNGTIIFTYTEKTDKFTHTPIYLVITVTNQLSSSKIQI